MDPLELLLPGDCLLYSGKGFVSWAIKVKTWSDVSHVSVYLGNKVSVASRDGEGVGLYPLRTDGLKYVLRPTEPVDLIAGLAWFEKNARGQKYDVWGLFRFFTIGKQSLDKSFCSEFATRFYRSCLFVPFAKNYDADLVAPGMFKSSPHFNQEWP